MNHESSDQQPKGRKLSGQEVAKHNNDQDCWLVPPQLARCSHSVPLNARMCRVIIHGKVYDVTEFKEEHPGGKSSESSTPKEKQTPVLNQWMQSFSSGLAKMRLRRMNLFILQIRSIS